MSFIHTRPFSNSINLNYFHCWATAGTLPAFVFSKKKKVFHILKDIYHHLVNGVDDVVHFRPRNETVVVYVVEFKRPFKRIKVNILSIKRGELKHAKMKLNAKCASKLYKY